MKTYSEMIKLRTFEDRFHYLKLLSKPGQITFGHGRWMNQRLYTSPKWRRTRNQAIVRDGACDLAIDDREIFDMILIHHLNPLSLKDLETETKKVFDLENLVCVSKQTHNAIHFGDESLLIPTVLVERKPFDTCPWK